MLERFNKFKIIINDILNNPDQISGLTNNQKAQFNDLRLTYSEWELVSDLIFLLSRFYEATKMLSGCKYPTLSLAFVVHKMLYSFLNTNPSNKDSRYVTQLKEAILPIFNYHLNDKISNKQKEATKVMVYLKLIFINID